MHIAYLVCLFPQSGWLHQLQDAQDKYKTAIDKSDPSPIRHELNIPVPKRRDRVDRSKTDTDRRTDDPALLSTSSSYEQAVLCCTCRTRRSRIHNFLPPSSQLQSPTSHCFAIRCTMNRAAGAEPAGSDVIESICALTCSCPSLTSHQAQSILTPGRTSSLEFRSMPNLQ